jgi:hypothetical protein
LAKIRHREEYATTHPKTDSACVCGQNVRVQTFYGTRP